MGKKHKPVKAPVAEVGNNDELDAPTSRDSLRTRIKKMVAPPQQPKIKTAKKKFAKNKPKEPQPPEFHVAWVHLALVVGFLLVSVREAVDLWGFVAILVIGLVFDVVGWVTTLARIGLAKWKDDNRAIAMLFYLVSAVLAFIAFWMASTLVGL